MPTIAIWAIRFVTRANPTVSSQFISSFVSNQVSMFPTATSRLVVLGIARLEGNVHQRKTRTNQQATAESCHVPLKLPYLTRPALRLAGQEIWGPRINRFLGKFILAGAGLANLVFFHIPSIVRLGILIFLTSPGFTFYLKKRELCISVSAVINLLLILSYSFPQ